MKDFSLVLLNKIDIIIEKWIEAVRQDEQIETAKELTYKGIRNSLPILLQAIATILSETEDSDIKTLINKALEHGKLRAKQGYDAEEIAREYRLVRWIIFTEIEEDLQQASATEVIRAMRLIDTAIDEVIARCFQTYTEERLKEFEQLQHEMRLTNQELTRLVRASKDNLAHLAHELKTPLTSIIGYSDLFLRQMKQNPELEYTVPNLEHIEKVLQNGRQLLHLINDSLEISRYEAGQMQLHPTEINPHTLITQILEMVEPLANTKQLKLTQECQNCPQQVITDPLRLQQILTNLLSNAIRYTQTGTIHLLCQTLPNNQWSITIKDTGQGITPEDQKHIFDPYFRVISPDKSYLPNSTGLGLAIVHRLVKVLKGQIFLHSEPGIGSTFTLILPTQ
ncbi:MAG TPA: HAMP domain-containing sensor histidine kinase [Halomicronema sp.]